MMEATRPIDSDIGRPSAQLAGGREGRPGIHITKIEHISEDRAVLDTIEVVNQVSHFILVASSDPGSTGPCEGCRGF